MEEHKGNISDIFNEYAVLKQELGYTLVSDVKLIFIIQ